VAVAVGRETWEPELVAALTAPDSGVHLARRCVDAVDLAAVAKAGLAEVVVVGSKLPRIDLNVVASLGTSGVQVIGVAADDLAANRLRALGVAHIVTVDATDVTVAVYALAALAGELRLEHSSLPAIEAEASSQIGGRITVVIGGAGAPGRTTLAANLAQVWSQQGHSTLLVDADTQSPVLASVLGVMTDQSGLARAARSAIDAADDSLVMHRALTRINKTLTLLSGAAGSAASDVARPSAIERVLAVAAATHDHVVVDTAPWSVSDLQSPVSAGGQPLRTLMGLADSLVIVGSADPIGLVRLLSVLTSTQHEAPQARHVVVLNRARKSALGGADADVAELLGRHVALPETLVIADDRAAADLALLRGHALVASSPKSRAALGLRELAARLSPETTTGRLPARVQPSSQRFGLRTLARRAG
jgi:MinD-like ATPase involved in chromosome partitioning or flagellar assembly